MNYDEAINYLWDIGYFGIKLGLENIEDLLGKLDNPHDGMKFIHIAGTNGKGSVAAMMSAVLKQKYKVGLFTSPHLEKFNERIKINDIPISDDNIARLTEMIKPLRGTNTFFETVTAMAFKYFKEQECDFVILEVGMGGRLDATNIVKPIVSIITNINIEHTKHLGYRIKDIAGEKAGIIKDNVPVVTSSEREALDVIKGLCDEKHCDLIIANPVTHKAVDCNLKGEFQEANMGCALEALKIVNHVSEEQIIEGMKNVVWPGRFEKHGKIVMDCAHNPSAMLAIRKEIRKLPYKRLIVVFAMMEDKDIERAVKIIYPITDKFIITKPQIKRAAEPEVIAEGLSEYTVIRDCAKALEKAKELANDDDLILVCGSIYLVGEVRKYIVNKDEVKTGR